MKVQNRYHCPSKCRIVTVSTNWHKQASCYIIEIHVYLWYIQFQRNSASLCKLPLEEPVFSVGILVEYFFFCDFLDNALIIIRTRLGNVCVKMYLWYCYSAMVVILCAAALTSQWGTRLYYMNDSPIVSHCYS